MQLSSKKIDIKEFSLSELKDYFKKIGIESFRAEQIFNWVYKKNVSNFSEMTDLPLNLRDFLERNFSLSSLKLRKKLISKDKTQKFLFETSDAKFIESVLIPHKKRCTLCVSTQIGCKFNCYFCASGKLGFIRNLSTSEILDQIILVKRIAKITNIVFMGIGEPLDNYENLIKSIRIITSPQSLNISQRKITVSTCGLVPQIERLSEENLKIELAVSLHTLDNDLRNFLMPINKIYSLDTLMEALKRYFKKTKREITFEYILFRGLNDSIKDAQRIRKIRGFKFKMNVIPYNPIEGIEDLFEPSLEEAKSFCELLRKYGIKATLRTPRGKDIKGGCGQLKISFLDKLCL